MSAGMGGTSNWVKWVLVRTNDFHLLKKKVTLEFFPQVGVGGDVVEAGVHEGNLE